MNLGSDLSVRRILTFLLLEFLLDLYWVWVICGGFPKLFLGVSNF